MHIQILGLGKYCPLPLFQCAFLCDCHVVCLFVTCQLAYYQSSGSRVTVTALYPHTQIHIPANLCLLPLPRSSSVPSVSIATGQNKLLIIGQGLSWQVVFNEICHILFQTGRQHTGHRKSGFEAVSFRK